MLDLIRTRFSQWPPVPRQPLVGWSGREAAILVPMTRASDPSLVFIKRAEHLTRHSGQVAFPGGMWEPEDLSLLHTALRESEEEIALPPKQVEVIASLPVRATRFDVRVSPYVGIIPEGLHFVPDPSELESVFQVPLSFLAEPGNLTTAEFNLPEGRYRAPCYKVGNYYIWGFTLQVVADILDNLLELRLPLHYQVLD
ncbi:MAG: CoA pyrophosphatase [Porticoccaceae bacterium]|nr:CoA pyrophosphatase [Porticoccaceae bacterium]